MGQTFCAPPAPEPSCEWRVRSVYLADSSARGDTCGVRHTLAEGVDVNERDYDMRTALHLAATDGHCEVIEILLNARADANLEDRWGMTPLDRAKAAGVGKTSPAVMAALRQASGHDDIDSTQDTIHYSSYLSEVEGPTAAALCCAAAANAVTRLQELYDSGMNIELADDRGRTAMHIACSYGHMDVVRFLIEKAADVSAEDCRGHTPAWEAARQGHTELVALLERSGARGADAEPMRSIEPLRSLAEAGQWAISAKDIEFGEELSRTPTYVVCRARWRALQVACKTTKDFDKNQAILADGCANTVKPAKHEGRLLREIETLSRLRHPDLVMFLGACLDYKMPLLVSVFLEGGNLEKYYARQARPGKPFQPSASLLLQWAAAVARALAFLHGCSHPIIHKRLKPVSLMLNANMELKVTDFGISSFVDAAAPGFSHQLSLGTGSVHYAAPELVREEECSDRVDIYSLGFIMWFMCTGRRPFVDEFGEDGDGLRIAYLQGKEPRPASKSMRCVSRFRQLTEDCWKESPSARPSADQCAQRIAELIA